MYEKGELTSTGWTMATSLREGAGWYRGDEIFSRPGGTPMGRCGADLSRRNERDSDDDIDMR